MYWIKKLVYLVAAFIFMCAACYDVMAAKDTYYKHKRISKAQYNRITSKQALQEQRRQEASVQAASRKVCSCGCGKVGCECSKQSE